MKKNDADFMPEISNGEVNLSEIVLSLLKYKWTIIITTMIFGLLGTTYAILSTPIYQAEALISPTTSSQAGGNRLSPLKGQYSGLISITGATLPTHHSLNTALAILQSRKFIQEFIRTHKLKPLLFPKNWDNHSNKWRSYSSSNNPWRDIKKYFTNSDKNISHTIIMEPSLESAYRKFKSALSITRNKGTQLITLAFSWHEPHQANQWVNELISTINKTLREQAINKSQNSITYLHKQLQTAQLTELRMLYAELVKEQIKNITLARAHDEYAFEVLDPAVTPKHPIKPKRLMITLLSLIIGAILGTSIALAKNFYNRYK